MPTHDIIDNRNSKLVDSINDDAGLKPMQAASLWDISLSLGRKASPNHLAHVKELKLADWKYNELPDAGADGRGTPQTGVGSEELEEDNYRKKNRQAGHGHDTAENIRSAIELMDQTDLAEETVTILVRMIEEKRLKVRVYTKGRMHAKAYIFTYGDTFNLLGNRSKARKGYRCRRLLKPDALRCFP